MSVLFRSSPYLPIHVFGVFHSPVRRSVFLRSVGLQGGKPGDEGARGDQGHDQGSPRGESAPDACRGDQHSADARAP